MPGTLILCASPIGNLGDAPPRLGQALASCDLVFCEDTRRTRILTDHLGVRPRLRSYFAGNEANRAEELRAALTEGLTVGLLTDAGTPAVSDPGVSAVTVARSVGATITMVPGPSALTAALALSGFPSERFLFEGFLPKKGKARADRISEIAAETRTVVLFVSPNQLADDLSDLARSTPDRPICLTRELTKKFEEVQWSTCAEAAGLWSEREPRGEFTLVLGPITAPPPDELGALEEVGRLVADGVPRSEAARRVATATGVSRRKLYDESVARTRETRPGP